MRGVIAGSEDGVMSFQLLEEANTFRITVLKIRKIPLKGISSIVIRQDQKIVIAGAWDSTVKLLQNHIAILDNKDDAMEMLGFDSTSYCSASLIQSLDWAKISSAYSELEV